MNLIKDVEEYVACNIKYFHEARLNKLGKISLKALLSKKNPYLYKAKNLCTPQEVVEALASAFMSSAEETMFGDWLEQLAIFVAGKVYGGYKSTSTGIDFEMDKDGIHYIVSVKSGPNWSNSSSHKTMLDNFARAKRIYRTGGNNLPCEAIEGCCYGRDQKPDKTTHYKLCGELFWSFISGSDKMYTEIIEPLGTNAHHHNSEYHKEYKRMISRFSKDFANSYCDENGDINWAKIVMMNSASSPVGKKSGENPKNC